MDFFIKNSLIRWTVFQNKCCVFLSNLRRYVFYKCASSFSNLGEKKIPEKCILDGEFLNGKLHGTGSAIFLKKGNVYQGEFFEGKIQGFGTMKFKNKVQKV